jgi:uncharacterized phage-associated protein
MRGFNYKKAIQALNYLATRNGGTLNKMKAIKLVWLSDRLHLRKYGRLITGDSYYALPNGPVPSATRDVLENSQFLDDTASEYAADFINQIDRYTFKTLSDCNMKVFSKTDIDCLDTIFEKFGHYDQFKLSDISHLYPEWKKHESALNKKISSRFPIDSDDFFTNIEDESDLFIDSAEILDLSKQMFSESKNLLGCI